MPGQGPRPYEQFVLLLVIFGGIAAVVFGFANARESIFDPLSFEFRPTPTLAEKELAEEQALRTKDTDADGLTDYDELNIWRTSPYLADSDSDGFSDKTEVDSGNNPNCPKGTDCTSGLTDTTRAADEVPAGMEAPLDLFPTPTQATLFGETEAGANLPEFLTNLTPADIRALLLQYGVDAATLERVDDAALVELYGEVLAEVAAPGEGAPVEE